MTTATQLIRQAPEFGAGDAPPAPPSLKQHHQHSDGPALTLAQWSPSRCPECAGQRRAYGRWLGEQRQARRSLVVDVDTCRSLIQQFHDLGLTNATISELTGLSRNNLQRISTGKTRTAHRRTEEALMELASRVTMRGRVLGAPGLGRPRALPHPRNRG